MSKSISELVFIPATGLGHIISMVELAKLLVNRDPRISITILIIIPPFGSGSGSGITAYIESLANKSIERMRFVQLPQNQTPPNFDAKALLTFINDFINSHSSYVRKVVSDMINRPGFHQLAGFVVDVFCTDMIDVAKEFDVPAYVFYTSNAAFLGFSFYIHALCETENQDVADFTNIDAVFPAPTFVKPVPTTAFPAAYQTKQGLNFLRNCCPKLKEAKAIMVNTFLELETHAIQSFSASRNDPNLPPVYPVGPILNLDGVAENPQDGHVISWLDDQPPSSVVFLCFGSMGSFDEVQVKEIAHALERSGHRFVWSLRRPPSPEQTIKAPGDYDDVGLGAVLPAGFLEHTVGIGRVIGWAPQAAMLAHHAIGGFVSHCGWNSVLESLWFGVPLATWPMYAEQQLNAFQLVAEMGLAVEIKLDYNKDSDDCVVVTAEEIESGIRRLMMEDTEVRAKVKEMSRRSREATMVGGSSYSSINRLVHDFVTKCSLVSNSTSV